jgi:phosphatidylglycerol---prolipoprotein diacylglyceryl transferase
MINWLYPLIMFAAVAAGALLLRFSQRELRLKSSDKVAIGLGAFCGAMLGAKLPFALTDWEGLRSGAVWFSNGKTIVCGMVGAYFGVELAKWICEIRIKTGDTFAVPAAGAVAIGRLSCFAAGCCYGTPTTLPWGVRSQLADGGLVARHPTQIYESMFHVLTALLMIVLRQNGIWRGQLIKFYIISYLVYRWLTEFIRPEPKIWLAFTGYQWFAILVIPIFAWLWWRDARRAALSASGTSG